MVFFPYESEHDKQMLPYMLIFYHNEDMMYGVDEYEYEHINHVFLCMLHHNEYISFLMDEIPFLLFLYKLFLVLNSILLQIPINDHLLLTHIFYYPLNFLHFHYHDYLYEFYYLY